VPWSLLLLGFSVATWLFWLVASWCISSFFAKPQPQTHAPLPTVSILKPVRGLDAEAYENFCSFLEQDYPNDYEVLFGVTNPQDPALKLVQRLQRDFPDRKIAAFVAPRRGANDKVSILCHLAQQAANDVFVVCDSDMRVTPDYLRRICTPLQDPAVGLVTCLYRGERPKTFTARLEALYMVTTFLPSVFVGRRYLSTGFALGATNALRREQLLEIGGFAPILNHLADDYQLGVRVAATGHRIHFSDYVAQSTLGPTTFREQWQREVRWAKCTRISRPLEYPGLPLTFSTPVALATAASLGFSPLGWSVLGVSLVLRWLVGWQMAHHTHDTVFPRAWFWLPLRDLLTAAVWCAALVGQEVKWRGERFALRKGGYLQPLPPKKARETTG